MTCPCVSGSRRLHLKLQSIDSETVTKLNELDYWNILDNGDWAVSIGGRSPYKTVEDLLNFIQIFGTPDLVDNAVGSWERQEAEIGCSSGCGGQQKDFPVDGWKQLTAMCERGASQLIPMLRGRSLTTYFQPIVKADGKSIWGYECLMRGIEKDGAIIPPIKLLQWAKAENVTSMLDRVCRENHLRNAAKLVPPGKKILINFIPSAIYEPSFCLRSTMEVLRQTHINPCDVIFEVVETEQVRDVQHLSKILDYYRNHGFRTALDDVGSGFSGLTMLANLRPDILKLDMELVQGASREFTYRVIVQGLVQIAKSCGQRILAEGVETVEQYDLMLDLGVDLFQGYLFGKPAPEPALQVGLPRVASTAG